MSSRVSTSLSVLSWYQVSVRHIRGINNALTDFGSRNPVECTDEHCHIWSFISQAEESAVRAIKSSCMVFNTDGVFRSQAGACSSQTGHTSFKEDHYSK